MVSRSHESVDWLKLIIEGDLGGTSVDVSVYMSEIGMILTLLFLELRVWSFFPDEAVSCD